VHPHFGQNFVNFKCSSTINAMTGPTTSSIFVSDWIAYAKPENNAPAPMAMRGCQRRLVSHCACIEKSSADGQRSPDDKEKCCELLGIHVFTPNATSN
jgi:hypothetical protein